jgi:hypothetical protein
MSAHHQQGLSLPCDVTWPVGIQRKHSCVQPLCVRTLSASSSETLGVAVLSGIQNRQILTGAQHNVRHSLLLTCLGQVTAYPCHSHDREQTPESFQQGEVNSLNCDMATTLSCVSYSAIG